MKVMSLHELQSVVNTIDTVTHRKQANFSCTNLIISQYRLLKLSANFTR